MGRGTQGLDVYKVFKKYFSYIKNDGSLSGHETERRYFELYSEVIMVDVTENANDKKRPMLLVDGRDADGSIFVVMRVYLPH